MVCPRFPSFSYFKNTFNCVSYIEIHIGDELTMETLLTNKTVSVTELREPRKVIDKAGSKPVAVLNRSNVVGYFVPASAVEKLDFSACEIRRSDGCAGHSSIITRWR